MAQGIDHGLRTIIDRQLAEYGGDVILDCLIGDAEDSGNFLIAVPLSDAV